MLSDYVIIVNNGLQNSALSTLPYFYPYFCTMIDIISCIQEIQKAVGVTLYSTVRGSIRQIFRHIDIRQIDICIIVSCTITIIIYPLIGVRAYAYTQEIGPMLFNIGPMLNNIGPMLNNIGPKNKKHDWKIFLKFFESQRQVVHDVQ